MDGPQFKTEPAQALIVRAICCEQEMKPTGHMLMSDPPKWPHKCERCGTVRDLDKRYPAIEYRLDDRTGQ